MKKNVCCGIIEKMEFTHFVAEVETMDDINISSLIEVLQNDFSDKQIIG
ncbi:MAG: hypothetical protein NC412_13840 [Roseburia sp.]|nr:hypothetical protein [Roseburia sp.]